MTHTLTQSLSLVAFNYVAPVKRRGKVIKGETRALKNAAKKYRRSLKGK